MCGIVGAVGLRAALDERTKAAVLTSLAHRGPDRQGEFTDRDCWFGFRRLCVQDLENRSDQPMIDQASGVAMVFNGEIYNFVELRRELESHGHQFLTTGDAEVVLRGYLHWGVGLFERCNGMWAVAIREPGVDGGLLSRDRVGEKPLHLARDRSGAWWFASEVGALIAAGASSGRADRERCLAFLIFGDIEDPASSYLDGVSQLPPGTWARLTPRGLGPVHQWWRTDEFVAEAWQRPPVPPEQLAETLDHAVQLRLRSDVPVGTSLSGGLDSSSVVASIRHVAPHHELHAFVASFPGRSIDEYERARLVAQRFGINLHRVEPTVESFVSELDRMILHQGGPVESPTVYAQWCVMKAARAEGVTVLLDGQGADEGFGGYPKYAGFHLLEQLLQLRIVHAWGLVRRWTHLATPIRIDVAQALGLLLPERARRAAAIGAAALRKRWLGPAFDGVTLGDPQGSWSGSLLQRAAKADLSRVVLPRLLRYADRNSMASAIEMRLPFLDPAVLAAGLSSRWEEGLSKGWTKWHLRQAVDHRLPQQIAWRRDKTAYETPNAEWLANPRVKQAVDDATFGLVQDGVLVRVGPQPWSAWRILTLQRFLASYRLSL
ncbi:MAG: asparagine synthase (glutamine-hydrolyzing) [Acidimicrobiales bacterium]|nr:asparagine synthase (glutamine-hydrolyzing) [Acidimicrobiales bacterium]